MCFHPCLSSSIVMVSWRSSLWKMVMIVSQAIATTTGGLYCENMLISLSKNYLEPDQTYFGVRLTTKICIYIQLMTGLKGMPALAFRSERPLWDTEPHLHPLRVRRLQLLFCVCVGFHSFFFFHFWLENWDRSSPINMHVLGNVLM